MSTFRFHLFRDFYLKVDELVINGFVAQKPRELLCYLLLHRDRPHLREALMTLLWEESDIDRAKKYFRQTLWQLQTDLKNIFGELGGRFLVSDSDWVHLNENMRIWSDVDALQRAFMDTKDVPGYGLSTNQLHILKDAEKLYRGDLLEGWYQDWCLFERERLQNIYIMILDKLVQYCETSNLFEDGILYSMRIFKIDFAREKTHRCLMRIYYNMGDRTNALRQYERCATILKEEMDVSPSQRTEKLFEFIKEDKFDPSTNPAVSQIQPAKMGSIYGLVYHLSQLRYHLSEAHQQVGQDIEIVQSILLKDQ